MQNIQSEKVKVWNIGKEIKERQEKQGWGKSIVEILSKDLQKKQ